MAKPFGRREVGQVITECPGPAQPKPVHWVEIQLVGEDGSPVPDVEYRVELPSGAVARGYLDQNGWARIQNVPDPGQCSITFPALDKSAWDPLASSPTPRAASQ